MMKYFHFRLSLLVVLLNASEIGALTQHRFPFQYRMDVNKTSISVSDGSTINIDSIEDGLEVLRQESLHNLTTRFEPVKKDGIRVLSIITTEMDSKYA